MYDKLTLEGKEELKYVIKINSEFPTYKCPFTSNMCYLKNKNIRDRWYDREICIFCKHQLRKFIKNKGLNKILY